ncbi:hypothetical protein [Nostoc sp. FACHB-280]|uniref:hypothetical protein n=1 Tax=Nostoc sp. FACHB-280 TaxID=2692839 RepID=UPI00168A97A6|nr:hypothetical protein [Nostoc sp. FACHB-280]MBD2498031.1 hypothetical protein [Nostoc sp. FACHB-280]
MSATIKLLGERKTPVDVSLLPDFAKFPRYDFPSSDRASFLWIQDIQTIPPIRNHLIFAFSISYLRPWTVILRLRAV